MSQSPKARGLGRGLSALLGDDEVATTVATPAPGTPTPSSRPDADVSLQAAARPPLTLPIGRLRPGKMQPRTSFEGIEALAESIKELGLLQPILVWPLRDAGDNYEIVAGERRWRAAQRAQLHDVPVVVRSIGDMDALQIGLVENLQRSDLTPIDEAKGYAALIRDHGHTQEALARLMGRSRPHIANTLRLLDLPAPVQEMLQQGQLSAGQGRALVGLPDPLAMAERAVAEKLTVRELERLSGEQKQAARRSPGKAPVPQAPKSADTRALEKRIEEALGLKATLASRGGEKTALTLEIADYDQLDTVVEKLTRR